MTTNWKILKRWESQTTLLVSWETCMQVQKQQLGPDMKQCTASKWGKKYVKAVYCYPAYLAYMKSTSSEMPDWRKPKLESRLPGEISINSDMQMIPLLWQKVKKTKRASWWRRKRRMKKAGLKLNSQKTKIMAPGPITSWQIDGETMETVREFILEGLQNHCIWN